VKAAADVCRAVASYGLPGGALPLPRRPLDPPVWDAVLERAARQRVTGHLAFALEEGAFAATQPQRSAAAEHHERALALDLLLERLLLASVERLEHASIPVKILKGTALAHTRYANPSLRSSGDVDLLVPGSHFDAAVETLCARGARRRYREPRRGFDQRFGKGACVETRDGLQIDVHRTFVAGPFGLAVDPDDLFATHASFRVADRELACLDLEAQLIHACFHATLGDAEPRLVPLRDVAQIALHADVDMDRIVDLCSRWQCGIVVQHATRLAWEAFALTTSNEFVRWGARYAPSPFERRALDAYVGPDRSYARQALAGLSAVVGVRAKAAYARALLVPDAPYLRERDRGYLRRLTRGVRLLVNERTGQ